MSSQPTPRQSYSTTPSLLNGSAQNQSVSVLNLPSPPESTASDQDTPELENEITRGRELTTADKPNADKLGKDSKGNVVISVRVKPEQSISEDSSELEWMVDGRHSSIAFRGREGGEHTYGKLLMVKNAGRVMLTTSR